MDFIHEFQVAMHTAGLVCDIPIIADGKIHRFKSGTDSKPNSWYILFTGKISAGFYGCWKRNIKQLWFSSHYKSLSSGDRTLVKKQFDAAKNEFHFIQNEYYEEVSLRANKIWQRSNDICNRNHPYLVNKKINTYEVKSYKNLLVIPLRDNHDKLWSLQFINPAGEKFFLKQGKKKGLYHTLGDISDDIILICEGYATACILYEATQYCVIIAFDANNLVMVAKCIRDLYPQKELIICADNDQFTSNNPGLSKGREAARLSNAKIVWPEFTSLDTKPTDFNDLYQLEGLDAVRNQILSPKNESHLPASFIVNEEGVFYVFPGDQPPMRICSNVEIIARTRDENGLSHGKLLAFRDPDGKKHQVAIPMEMLAGDGIEYRRLLLSNGLEIAPSRKAREQLTHYILNSRPEKIVLCLDQIGWYKNTFILPDQTIGDSGDNYLLQTSNTKPSQSGSLQGWQNAIAKYCEGNTRLAFVISMAFAAPLLYLLQEESGGIHFIGPSSIGKTTLLQVACSVWGDPERLQRWRATCNGLEAIAASHNDSLLCLDEMGQADPREIGEIAYMLANGSGKNRCMQDGSIRKKANWRLLFLSTGELGLSDHVNQSGKTIRAGQEVRLLDIPADAERGLGVFEMLHDFQSAVTFARYLGEATKQYYGAAIREFLCRITQDIQFVKNYLTAKKIKFIESNVPPEADGQIHRVALRFSLVAAAGELATFFNITGWQECTASYAVTKCFQDWVALRGGIGAKESTIALSQVRHFFELHGESRFSSWQDEANQVKTANRAGFRRDSEFFVFPEVFRQDICIGLNPRYVAKLCIKKGWLLADSSGKTASVHRMPDTGRIRRVYHFCDKMFEEKCD
jgi:putative DNA primase/helicase